ncbi:MAG: class I SAM-dependent methyltransferase [Anaerolineales bacterium]
MNIQKAYNEWSDSYDTDNNLTRDLDQRVTQEALANLRFNSILEVGCGTGKNTAFLAQIGTSVHALDFSEGMIEKAREKVRAENVRFSMADITKRWTFQDRLFDLVLCNLVLEHIEDLSHIFSEARRTLKKKGRFFINELHPFKQYEGKKARFIKGEGTIEVEAFVHHISDFTNAAAANGLTLVNLNEYWHAEDQNKQPRLISFMFMRA